MKNIYLVSKGEYSDYDIVAVLEKKEDAQLFIDKFQIDDSNYHNDMEIETRVLNPWIPELKKGLRSYRVRIDKEGNISECILNDDIPTCSVSDFFFDCIQRLVVDCMARDKNHAIKIANDKRIMAIAENRWKK